MDQGVEFSYRDIWVGDILQKNKSCLTILLASDKDCYISWKLMDKFEQQLSGLRSELTYNLQ